MQMLRQKHNIPDSWAQALLNSSESLPAFWIVCWSGSIPFYLIIDPSHPIRLKPNGSFFEAQVACNKRKFSPKRIADCNED